jgi:hypothetical protein
LIGFSAIVALVGVEAVPVPAEPVLDFGDSESVAFAEVGVVALAIEFFLLAAFFDLAVPTGAEVPLPRLRFLITSVFKLSGRTTPWSFRNKPQALQSGCPSGFRRHRGVVCVKQLVQVVGTPLFSPCPGLPGRDGTAEEKPDSCGEEGDDCVRMENMPVAMPTVLGVEVVRGILRVLGSPPRFLRSVADVADP